MPEGMKTRRQELEELVELNRVATENLIHDVESGGGIRAKNLLREVVAKGKELAVRLAAEPKA